MFPPERLRSAFQVFHDRLYPGQKSMPERGLASQSGENMPLQDLQPFPVGIKPTIDQQKAKLFAYLDGQESVQRVMAEARRNPVEPNFFGSALEPPARKIWLYWDQGWENAPPLVQLCLRSWQLNNPECEVHALDRSQLAKWLPSGLTHERASGLAGFSDRIRLKLLRRWGGIWADATAFCSQPAYMFACQMTQLSQFFVYSYPAADRLISSWFVVSSKESFIVNVLDGIIDNYFENLSKDEIQIHCYFFFHYIVEYMIFRGLCVDQFKSMPVVCVNHAARLSHMLKLENIDLPDDDIEAWVPRAIETQLKLSPIHKLTWKGSVGARAKRAERLREILENHLEQRKKLV